MKRIYTFDKLKVLVHQAVICPSSLDRDPEHLTLQNRVVVFVRRKKLLKNLERKTRRTFMDHQHGLDPLAQGDENCEQCHVYSEPAFAFPH